MTSISPKQYYNEIDNYVVIKNTLKKECWKKYFIFLYNHFFVHKNPTITLSQFTQDMGIINYSKGFQILRSLIILNMMEKKKIPNRRDLIYCIRNHHWWEDNFILLQKEEEKSGCPATDNII